MNDLMTKVARAASLTRSGDVTAATALIRDALGTGPAESRSSHSSMQPRSYDFFHAADPSVVSVQGAASRKHEHARHERNPPDEPLARQVRRAHFEHRGIELDYRLFTPDSIEHPAPLLVLLHGCTQDSTDFAVGTGMDRLAQKAGVHVLYPAQNRSRNLRNCWNWFEPAHQKRGAGEVGALHALTRDVASAPTVDDARVFVAGMSAGGAMALLLASEYPHVYAGVGVHSGLPCNTAQTVAQALATMRGERRPAKPSSARHSVPLIVFQGSADTVVHPCNADHIIAANVANDGIASESHSGTCNGRDYTRHLYRTSQGQVVCEHWNLIGGAHQWSGGNPAGSHTSADGPDASAEILRFFMKSS